MQRILFVCLGNICRSPTAEAVFRRMAQEAGLSVGADSAGTGDWHRGEAPHPPAVRAAKARGYDLSALRARQVRVEDFAVSDLILAMDRRNLADLEAMAPAGALARLGLFMDLAPELALRDVPDPWFTGEFDRTLDLIEAGCRGLVARLRGVA
ncbi:low molecular weight protein-tyrosine-phosphatase [Pseudogemmobacter sonorensis]|uniref:low molecular weight protein-tyrosine-phosphatase n=1 Tax=Pseudogemmobacter sonorensis TaxID=2989681 RepID=UPI0036B6802C